MWWISGLLWLPSSWVMFDGMWQVIWRGSAFLQVNTKSMKLYLRKAFSEDLTMGKKIHWAIDQVINWDHLFHATVALRCEAWKIKSKSILLSFFFSFFWGIINFAYFHIHCQLVSSKDTTDICLLMTNLRGRFTMRGHTLLCSLWC